MRRPFGFYRPVSPIKQGMTLAEQWRLCLLRIYLHTLYCENIVLKLLGYKIFRQRLDIIGSRYCSIARLTSISIRIPTYI